jgi:hypothetical protein
VQVLLWTFCLFSSFSTYSASKAEFIDSHNYLLREKVGCGPAAEGQRGIWLGYGLGWRFLKFGGN